MTAKTQALIKEVASLFAKYSLADWLPLIEELEKGERGQLAVTVRELASTPRVSARPKGKAKKPATKKAAKPVVRAPAATTFSAERTKFLEPLLRALKGRVVAPTAHDMRELYLAIGIKDAYPQRRDAAAEAITRQLDRMPDEQFRKILSDIVGPEDEDDHRGDAYSRWFNLILEPARRPPLQGDLGSKQAKKP